MEKNYIENKVYFFNKKNFNKILNLGELYKKSSNNNKKIDFISKKKIIKEYLTDAFNNPENIENNQFMTSELINKIHDEVDSEYVYDYYLKSVNLSGKVHFFSKGMTESEILKVIEKVVDYLAFFIEYCLQINIIIEDVPIFKIYYTSMKKVLHDNPMIPFDSYQMSSAMTQNPYIMVWRKEEFTRCIVHEFMHYYNLEFRFYTYPSKFKYEIYDIYRINALNSIRPNESFCDCFANVFNIIIFLMRTKKTIDYDDFAKLFIKEIKFSLAQIAKIFTFLEYDKAEDFYLPSTKGFDLRQAKTDVLCYYYFKMQLLVNLDKFLSIINPHHNKPFFYIKYSQKIPYFFNNYQKIIIDKNPYVNNIINKFMVKYKNLNDNEYFIEGIDNKSLRTTIIEEKE